MFQQSSRRLVNSVVDKLSIGKWILVLGLIGPISSVSLGQVILIPDGAVREVSASAEVAGPAEGPIEASDRLILGPGDPGVIFRNLSTTPIGVGFTDGERPSKNANASASAGQGIGYELADTSGSLEIMSISGGVTATANFSGGDLGRGMADAFSRYAQSFTIESATPFTFTGTAFGFGDGTALVGFGNGAGISFGATTGQSVFGDGVAPPGLYSIAANVEVAVASEDGASRNSSADAQFNLTFGEAINRIRWDTGDGSFEFNTNWDPQAVPGSDDTAIFEVPAAYTVNVGSQEVNRLRIGGGPSAETTFTNTDLTVQNSSQANPGVVVDSGNFILADGTLTSVHSVIGESTQTSATVESGATWNQQASLTAGQGGETTLSIERGGVVKSPTMTIGNDPSGNAQTDVFVNGGSLNVGSFLVGKQSTGQLFVLDGGEVAVDSHDFPSVDEGALQFNLMRIGSERFESGPSVDASGRVVVSGVDSSGVRSSLSFVGANIHISGDSELLIEDGGEVVMTELLGVGTGSGTPRVTVRGVNNSGSETIRSTLEVNDLVNDFSVDRAGEILVGIFGEGSAELNIVEGGVVKSTRGHIGNASFIQGRGVANVVGMPNDFSVGWTVEEQLVVSGTEGTELNVSDGGSVEINYFDARSEDLSLVIGRDPNTPDSSGRFGKVTVSRASNIDVGRETTVEVGTNSTGTLVLEDGGKLSRAKSLVIGDERQFDTGGEQNDSGTVIIRGTDFDNTFAELSVASSRNLVVSTGGLLSVLDGASAESHDIIVSGVFSDLSDQPIPTLEIIGRGSAVFAKSEVVIGEPSRGGAGKVTVSDGGSLLIQTNEDESVFLTLGSEQRLELETGAVVVGGIRADIEGGLQVGELFIGDNGVLRGAGTIVARNVNEGQSGVNNFAGTVLPGLSPGILTIDGNFMQGELGTTVLEIGGILAGVEHDQIVVTGDATINGTIQMEFIDGFAPSEGDSFDLFNVMGETNFIGSTFDFEGLEDGFEFDFGINDRGSLGFTALNDGIFIGTVDGDPANGAVPEPSTWLIWIGLGTCFGLAKWRRRTK